MSFHRRDGQDRLALVMAGLGLVKVDRTEAEGLAETFQESEIAIGKAVSREPVIYVRNIYKYYVAFKLVHELRMQEHEGP